MDIDNEDENEDMPGWGHWALPNHDHHIDQELHVGEFLALNDLMAPIDDVAQVVVDNLQQAEANSNITISLEPPNNSADTATSTNGPLAPNLLGLPDLNGVAGPDDGIEPTQAQVPPLAIIQVQPQIIAPPVLEDMNLSAILLQPNSVIPDNSMDPMALEFLVFSGIHNHKVETAPDILMVEAT